MLGGRRWCHSLKESGGALTAAGKSGVKTVSNGQRLHICWYCSVVSIFSHTGGIHLLEEKPYAIVFCAYIQAHKHIYIYIRVYAHSHTHLQGCRLECEAERQLYFIEGSVPDLFFFCVTFPHFYKQNSSKHSYADSYSLHSDVRLTTLVSKRKLDLQFFSYLFYWILFPKVYISTFYQDICILNLLYTSAVGFLLEICKKSAKEEKKEAI